MTTTAAEKAASSAETRNPEPQPGKADKPTDKRRALGRGLDSLLPTSPLRENRAGWPAPAPTGTMATPGLLALPCQTDAICGLHHCNTQYGKCAFPCQTAVDCQTGSNCMMGVCVPGGGT